MSLLLFPFAANNPPIPPPPIPVPKVALPKLQDVQEALKTAIVTALAAAGVPGTGQVYLGWPTGSEEVQKLGQPFPEGSITIYPIRSSANATRYPWEPNLLTNPAKNLTAIVANNVVTFYGVIDISYNIHGFFMGKQVDAYYATTAGQTLISLATSYAQTINDKAIPGVTAVSNGASVILSGASFQVVNVGSNATFAIEEYRVRRTLQVSLWINDVPTRWAVMDAILSSIGSSSSHFLTLSDGTLAYIRYLSDYMDDTSESMYSMYAHHVWYEVEYGQVQYGTAYQVGSLEVSTELNANTLPTAYYGEP
jgi:hypothetical protein